MSKLVKVVCDVAQIRGRHLQVHDEIFHLSAREMMRFLSRGKPDAESRGAAELDLLLQRLGTAQSELGELDESDLSIRRGGEIQAALADYVTALTESVQLLRSISEHSWRRATKNEHYDPGHLQQLKVNYDDALQHHKRLGVRLNALIAAL